MSTDQLSKARKKLVFFDFITHYGGAQKSTVMLCRRMKKHYDIEVIDAYGCCHHYLNDLSENDLPVTILCRRSKDVVIGHNSNPLARFSAIVRQLPHFIGLTRRLSATINRTDPDLIWTNNIKSLFFLSFCRQLHGSALGLYARGWCQKESLPMWQRWMVRQSADIIFALSNSTKKEMVIWGVDNRKVHLVHPALELNELTGKECIRKNETEKRCPQDFKILVPGSLIFTKGQHTVIEAVRILKLLSQRKITVWLAGDRGIGDSSGYDDFLKDKVSEYSLNDEVRFLGFRKDLAELMKEADVMVLATHTEGMPRVVQEAILLRCPVITTNVGGIPDLISDEVTGFIVEVGRAIPIARKILHIMNNPEHAEKVANRAYQRYTAVFRQENQLRQFNLAVKSVLKQK